MGEQPASTLNWIVDLNPIARGLQWVFRSRLLSDLTDYFYGLLFQPRFDKTSRLLFTVGIAAITYRSLAFAYKQYKAWSWLPAHFRNRKTVS